MHTHTSQVSIIIPAKNEEDHIGRLVESINKQAYDKEKIEIILVEF